MLRMSRQTVLPEWIDYNGHMNVAYYVMALDHAFDELLEDWIGIGESFVARSRLGPMSLQAQTFYIAEMVEGEAFHVDIQLIDYDAKRFHFYGEMNGEMRVLLNGNPNISVHGSVDRKLVSNAISEARAPLIRCRWQFFQSRMAVFRAKMAELWVPPMALHLTLPISI